MLEDVLICLAHQLGHIDGLDTPIHDSKPALTVVRVGYKIHHPDSPWESILVLWLPNELSELLQRRTSAGLHQKSLEPSGNRSPTILSQKIPDRTTWVPCDFRSVAFLFHMCRLTPS